MGIDLPTFRALQRVRGRLPAKTVDLASFGYPDLLVEEDVLRVAMPDGEWLMPAKDGEKIARWHAWPGPVYDTDWVMKGLGIEAAYFDIAPSRQIEEKIDLNMPAGLHHAFDIVLDAGTTEHCFNIGTAMRNIREACKPGGYIIHTNPMSMVNHGFWNFNPTTYIDFYTQCGDEVESVSALFGRLTAREEHNLKTVGRVQIPPEVSSLVVVHRLEGETTWPTQSKYLNNKDLKA
jgi:SAM-dependent methyltransferase